MMDLLRLKIPKQIINYMKRILLLYLLIVLCFACKNSENQTKAIKGGRTFHFNLTNSHLTEPVTLLHNRGFYHLFYIDSDKSNVNKVNCLGHAISKDLIRWSESPKSTFSNNNNSIYRGGIIIDSNNITGYGTIENPPLVALFAVTDNIESRSEDRKNILPMLAYSNDNGNSWTISTDKINSPEAFLNNPQNIGIFWHQPTLKWIMSLALSDHVEFYSSPDLRFWNFESSFRSDYFSDEINLKRTILFSSSDEIHWVLLIDIKSTDPDQSSGGTIYLIGSFDGHNFINQSSQPRWLDYGKDIYGSIVFTGTDERRINVVWMNGTGEKSVKQDYQETGITTFSRQLSLDNVKGELAISVSPVAEMKEIYGKEIVLGLANVSSTDNDLPIISGIRTPIEVILKFNTSEIKRWNFPSRFGVIFWNKLGEHLSFGYDTSFRHYFIDKSGTKPFSGIKGVYEPLKMPFNHSDSTMSLHLVVDISTFECYAEDGKLVMTGSYSSRKQFNKMTLFAENGKLDLSEGKVINLTTR